MEKNAPEHNADHSTADKNTAKPTTGKFKIDNTPEKGTIVDFYGRQIDIPDGWILYSYRGHKHLGLNM